MRESLNRLLDWFRRDRLDAELAEELRFHREQLERDARHLGAPGEVAAHAARTRLGNATITSEAARERWSWPWLDHLQQDVRHALRGLRRAPAFTTSVILTLALGIGANAAMFGLLDRLMLRPYPLLRDPGHVHRVYAQFSDRGMPFPNSSFEYTTYLDFQRWTSSMSDFAAFTLTTSPIGLGEASRERLIGAVSASFFGFFDAPPALGRYFAPSEDRTPRGATVAVLDHGYWMSEYGGKDVLGQTIQVGNEVLTIIGVAPRGFNGVSEDRGPVVYMPITTFASTQPMNAGTSYFTKYDWVWMDMMVRRKPGVSEDAARVDLTNAYGRSWNAQRAIDPQVPAVEVAHPEAFAGPLKSAAGPIQSPTVRTMRWVAGVAVIVLLIACANVANLFLGRALRRRREMALRLALGVRRRRLASQALTESLVLALMGCGVGVLVAEWAGTLLRRAFMGRPDATLDVVRDSRTLLVALGAALLASTITALVPLFFAGRTDLASALKASARDGTYQPSRLRSALLVLQTALSVVLLVGAGLFVRSLDKASSVRLGYDVDRLVIVSRKLRGTRLSDNEKVRLGQEALRVAGAMPQVESATWVSSVPFRATSTANLFVPGIDSVDKLGRFSVQAASEDYFQATGTRILRGRGFTNADREGTPPVVVVSESMARVLWPGQDAIGKCIRIDADSMPCTSVAGIAEDAMQTSLEPEGRNRFYLPLAQFHPAAGLALIVRVRGDLRAALEPVRKAVQAVMPGQSYVTVTAMEDVIAVQRRAWRLGATLFVCFGGLAMLVAAVGMYGVVAYNVTQRLQEIGVRMALGAQNRDVIRLVVGQAITFAAGGAIIGGALAYVAGHWVQPLLYQQSARDPLVFGFVALVLVGVALLASSVPAASATRADPQRALRSE